MIDVHKIVNLHTVAREGSFSSAAEQLHLSQPALSRSIAALEKVVGARLVKRERGRTGIEITDAGLDLLSASSGLLAEISKVEARYAIAREVNATTLSFGVGPMLASVLVPEVLRNLMQIKGLGVRVDVGSGQPSMEKLANGELDFFLGPIPNDGLSGRLHMIHFASGFEPYLWVREGHPLLDVSNVSELLEELRDYPKVSGTAWNEVIVRHAGRPSEAALVSTVQIDNHEIQIKLARATDAVLISSVDCQPHGFVHLTPELVPTQLLEEIYLIHPKGVTMSRHAQEAIELLRRTYQRYIAVNAD
jgi:molybdate transport repressor ModE-like protein